MLEQLNVESISIGELFGKLEHRSFGGIIVILSLFGLIPGISILAGLCILFLSTQIIIGKPTPTLPKILAKRQISVVRFKKLMTKPLYYITQMEKLIKPRWEIMLLPICTRITGVIILSLALIMISPLPLSNILPALALLQIALGLLETDGLAMLTGWAFSVIAIVVGILMIVAAIEFATWFLAP